MSGSETMRYERYRYVGPLIGSIIVVYVLIFQICFLLDNNTLTSLVGENSLNTFLVLFQIGAIIIGVLASDAISYMIYHLFHFLFWNRLGDIDGYSDLWDTKLKEREKINIYFTTDENDRYSSDIRFTYIWSIKGDINLRQWMYRHFSIYYSSMTGIMAISLGIGISVFLYVLIFKFIDLKNMLTFVGLAGIFTTILIILMIALFCNGQLVKQKIVNMIDLWLKKYEDQQEEDLKRTVV